MAAERAAKPTGAHASLSSAAGPGPTVPPTRCDRHLQRVVGSRFGAAALRSGWHWHPRCDALMSESRLEPRRIWRRRRTSPRPPARRPATPTRTTGPSSSSTATPAPPSRTSTTSAGRTRCSSRASRRRDPAGYNASAARRGRGESGLILDRTVGSFGSSSQQAPKAPGAFCKVHGALERLDDGDEGAAEPRRDNGQGFSRSGHAREAKTEKKKARGGGAAAGQ